MVSIIIPVYNIEDYVDKAVCSAVKQSYTETEIILVDDGSTDKSGKICDEYAKKYNNIRVVHKRNGGLSSARNAGLDAACGDFIMLLDGDDYIALDAVEHLMEAQKKTYADIVQYGYIETECGFSEEYVNSSVSYELIEDQRLFFERLYTLGGEGASACTKLYKRSLFKNLRFKEGILHEDEFMATRMLRTAKSICYTNLKPYFYVMRQGSIIKSDFNLKKLDLFYVKEDRIAALKELGYDELLGREYEGYFSSLINLYCSAAKLGSRVGCDELIKLISDYPKFKYKPKGRNRFFYNICRVDPRLVHIYYLLRKYFGHIE